MSDLSEAVARSGAIDADMLRELTRWKLPGIALPEGGQFTTPEEAVEAIENAVTGEHQVEVRVTDLDVLKCYLQTRKQGKLCIVNDEKGTSGTWKVTFGVVQRPGHVEYVLPWSADSIEDLLTNGRSYLLDGNKKLYFSLVTELFFGDQKAFILCTPLRDDHDKHKSEQG